MTQEKNDFMIQGWESPVAIHPGEFLKDMLDECSITQLELAQRTDISKKIINDIVQGKNPITLATAFKLSKVFDLSVEYWINLQNLYDSDKARLEEAKRIEGEVNKYIFSFKETYKELTKYNLVDNLMWTKTNFASIILELQRYFGVDSLGLNKFILKAAFRKYSRNNINHFSLAAWLRLGQIEAKKTTVKVFDRKILQDNLENIRSLSMKTPEEYLPEIKNILAEAGIVVVYAPYFKNTYAQGATEWIDRDKAYIILKTTKQGEDKFWFNLFHEMGHILKNHSKKEIFINFDNGDESDIEKEANDFAQDKLIPDYKELIVNYTDLRTAIESIAKQQKISQSIVAGRIAYENKNYQHAWKLTNGFIGKIDFTSINTKA
ncbi:MAG: HigA family addiction module antitoxin [Candidatus Paceibacterota bacterium]|jgi:HTH-type transcriptional regulator/antitoxin HigA